MKLDAPNPVKMDVHELELQIYYENVAIIKMVSLQPEYLSLIQIVPVIICF